MPLVQNVAMTGAPSADIDGHATAPKEPAAVVGTDASVANRLAQAQGGCAPTGTVERTHSGPIAEHVVGSAGASADRDGSCSQGKGPHAAAQLGAQDSEGAGDLPQVNVNTNDH